jgi:hypothetical protein
VKGLVKAQQPPHLGKNGPRQPGSGAVRGSAFREAVLVPSFVRRFERAIRAEGSVVLLAQGNALVVTHKSRDLTPVQSPSAFRGKLGGKNGKAGKKSPVSSAGHVMRPRNTAFLLS